MPAFAEAPRFTADAVGAVGGVDGLLSEVVGADEWLFLFGALFMGMVFHCAHRCRPQKIKIRIN